MNQKSNRKKAVIWESILWLSLTIMFFFGGLAQLDQVSEEAIISEGVCRQLAENTTEGRQALVSSSWWAPLPFLVRVPLAWMFRCGRLPVSALLVGAAFGAGTVLLVDRILKGWGFGLGRYLFLLGLLINPSFIRSCMNGSSETMGGFLALTSTLGLAGWISDRKLRYLVFFSVGLALLAITSLTLSVWSVALLVLYLIDLLFLKGGWRRKEAVLILGVLPLLYTIGIWVLMNWLIMGDGLYFVRNLNRVDRLPRILIGGLDALHPSKDILSRLRPLGIHYVHVVTVAILLLSTVVAIVLRKWAGVCLGLAGVAVFLLAVMTAGSGVYWDTDMLLGTLFLVCVLGLGLLGQGLNMSGKMVGTCLGCVPIVLSMMAMFHFCAMSQASLYTAVPAPRMDIQEGVVSDLEQYVLRQSRYGKVFVCGYDAFLLLGPSREGVFEAVLDLNINKVKNDYHGHALFLLVHKPEGKSGTDSVHWQFDRLYQLGSRSTLYDSDWGDWRLFEIIQAER